MTNQENQEKKQISVKAKSNINELQLELVTSSAYFKPLLDRTYVVEINPENKWQRIENPRFAVQDPKTGETKIPPRYEFKIAHVDNGKEQLWTVSKTVCGQIIEQWNKSFSVFQITRHGTDRSTTYDIVGVQ
jgi:hypothetical protein